MEGRSAYLVVFVFFIFLAFGLVSPVNAAPPLQYYVNQTGWWVEGGDFTPSFWPIEHAILNVSSPGSTVTIVEQGNYSHAITFWSATVQDGITLDLNGSTLDGTAFGVPAVTIEGKNDITIKGGTIYKYTNGIRATGVYSNLRLENLTISQTSSDAIRLEGTPTNVVIDKVTITESSGHGITKDAAGTLTGITITDSIITSPAGDGIYLYDDFNREITNILIDNVTVTGPANSGMTIRQWGHPSSQTLTVLNSTISGVSHHGLNIDSRGPIRLENNTVENSATIPGTYGFYVVSQTADSLMTFTNDNKIIANGNGLYLQNFKDLTLAPGTNIRNNRGNPYNIQSCSNFTLEDTVIDKAPGFSYLNAVLAAGTTANLRLENLTIANSTNQAIYLGGGTFTDVVIDNVTITESGNHGITKDAAGTLTGITITDSIITSPAGDGIYLYDDFNREITNILIDNVTVTGPANSGMTIRQWGHPSSQTLTVLNSTISGVSHHGLNIDSRGPIRLENNTVENSATIPGTYGFFVVSQTADSLMTFTNDNKIIANGNGLYLQNFKDLTLAPGTNIRNNRGNPYNIQSCSNFTLEDTVIDKAPGFSYLNAVLAGGTCTDFNLRNLTIANSSNQAIYLGGGTFTDVVIDKVTITESSSHGITKDAPGTLTGITIRDLIITSPAVDGIYLYDDFNREITNILIDNVTVTGPANSGMTIRQWGHPSSQTLTILNSTISGVSHHGLNIDSRGPIRLENNTVENSATIPGTYGFFVVSQTADSLMTFTNDNKIIANGNGLYLQNFKDLSLEPGTNIRNNRGNPYNIQSCNNFTLKDTVIDKAPGLSYLNAVLAGGTCADLNLRNLTIANSTNQAIYLGGGTFTDVVIDKVTITESGNHGITKDAAGTLTGITITDSIITSPAVDGIYLYDDFNREITNILIDNVTVTGPANSGMVIQQQGHPSSQTLTILNSTISGVSHHGLNINSRGPVCLVNNTVENSATIPGTYGLYIVSQTADSVMTFTNDNKIINCANGLYLQNFRDVTLEPGTNIRNNRGQPYSIESCNNFTLKDTVIDNTGGDFINGIRASGTYANLRLENLTISHSGEPAIRMEGIATDITIDRVTIDQPGSQGIVWGGSSLTGVTIMNSIISQPTESAPASSGIYFWDGGSNPVGDVFIDNVTLTNITFYGFHLPRCNNVTIVNSSAKNTGNWGFYVVSAELIRLENNTAEGSGDSGMYLVGEGNPLFIFMNNTLVGNGKGASFFKIRGNLNESRIQSTNTDITAGESSLINTYNTTFDKAKDSVTSSSLLNVFWFVDLTVVDESLNPVDGAAVTVTNASGGTVYSGTTNNEGMVSRFALNEYTKNSTAEVFHTPFLFHAEKAGGINETAYNVDHSMAITLVLNQTQPAPVADFTANTTTGVAPLSVQFNDTSTGSPATWSWTFGDGNTSNDQDPVHTYALPGPYTVNLTVSNDGGSDDELKADFITVDPISIDSAGVYRNSTFFLRNSNTGGVADLTFVFGMAGDRPVSGDWNDDGTDTIGVYRNGRVYLRNSNTGGVADITFNYGVAGDIPVTGDWDGDNTDTIGVYRNSRFYLRNSNTGGVADIAFVYGVAGDIPVAGDWDGDGTDTIGVFRNGTVYLRNSNTGGVADLTFAYGMAGDLPVAGNWTGTGHDTIGIYRNGWFYLRNSNTGGVADLTFSYGAPGDVPRVGNWDGT